MNLQIELPKIMATFITVELAQAIHLTAGVMVSMAWLLYLGIKIRKELREKKPENDSEDNS